MEKVTVTRVMDSIDSGYFRVTSQKLNKAFVFKINAPDDSIYNEERNRKEALMFAKFIETGKPTEEIIYETPNQTP